MRRFRHYLNRGFVKSYLRDFFRHLDDDYNRYEVRRRYPDAEIDEDVTIYAPDRLTLGQNVLIMKGSIIHCGGMDWCDYRGRITLGDRCAIGYNCILLGAGEIEMENDSGCSFNVMVLAQEGDLLPDGMASKNRNTRLRYGKIIFREGAWAVSGAIVLPGTEIGRKSVVGCGAVVKGKIPPESLVLGNPPRIIPRKPTELSAEELKIFMRS